MIKSIYDQCSQWTVRARMPLTAASCKHQQQQQPRGGVLIAWWCCAPRQSGGVCGAVRGTPQQPPVRTAAAATRLRRAGASRSIRRLRTSEAAAHWLQMAKTRPKTSSLDVIWQNFPNKFHQIQMLSIFGHCRHFIFTFFQTIPGISVISQFHEVLNLVLGGFYAIWNHCGLPPSHAAAAPHSAAGKPTPSLLQWVTSICLSQTNVMGLFTTPSRFS